MTKRAIRSLVGAAAAVALLAGCSGDDAGTTEEAPPASAAGGNDVEVEPVEESTASEDSSTVEQWASRVAENAGSIREAESAWSDDYGCLPGDTEAICATALFTMGLAAESLAIAIEGGTTEGVPAFIGEPPMEIAQLVEDTRSAAEQAGESASAASQECRDDGNDCRTLSAQTFVEYGSLLSRLDAWQPYGVN